jgi:serine/threonine protein kinase
MGEVYRARDTRLGRLAAIKLISPAQDVDARARLLQEAFSAAILSHPHICTVYDVGEEQGCVFVVMEHVEGSRSTRSFLVMGSQSSSSSATGSRSQTPSGTHMTAASSIVT